MRSSTQEVCTVSGAPAGASDINSGSGSVTITNQDERSGFAMSPQSPGSSSGTSQGARPKRGASEAERLHATPPAAKRVASSTGMTGGARIRAIAVLQRLMRAAGTKRVNPGDKRVELLNALFRRRIASLAQKLTLPAPPRERRTLAPRADSGKDRT